MTMLTSPEARSSYVRCAGPTGKLVKLGYLVRSDTHRIMRVPQTNDARGHGQARRRATASCCKQLFFFFLLASILRAAMNVYIWSAGPVQNEWNWMKGLKVKFSEIICVCEYRCMVILRDARLIMCRTGPVTMNLSQRRYCACLSSCCYCLGCLFLMIMRVCCC